MQVKGMKLAWIVVKDLKKSIDFYTKVVGLKLKEHHEEFGWAELCGEDEGTRLGIAQMSDHETILPGQNAITTFSVDNLEKAKQHFVKMGGTLQGEVMEVPGMVKLQMCLDSDKNHFQIVEELHAK